MTTTDIAALVGGRPKGDPVARAAHPRRRGRSRVAPLRAPAGVGRPSILVEPAAEDGALLLDDCFDDLDDTRLDRLIDMPGGWCPNRRPRG